MSDWFDRLRNASRHAGHEPLVWQTPDALGGRLLIYPQGARIMACQMPGVEGNLFFHHAGLEDPNRAAALLAGGGGVGGDRLWIAPESAYMWKDLAAARHDLAAHAYTPLSMDPADYRQVSQGPSHLQLLTAMHLVDGRNGQPLSLRVNRAFTRIDPPASLPSDLACMSFAIHNEVVMLQAGDQAHAGGWDLLQVPPTGTLICPITTPATGLRSYYEPLESHVKVMDGATAFLIDAKKRVKMGLSPELTTGRMGYYRRVGDVSTLIVRIFSPQPGQAYVDLPVDEILEGKRLGGDALQAYNHNMASMAFGEMEYHDPAVRAGHPPLESGGRSVTHVLAGADASIRHAGRMLLGTELVDLSQEAVNERKSG